MCRKRVVVERYDDHELHELEAVRRAFVLEMRFLPWYFVRFCYFFCRHLNEEKWNVAARTVETGRSNVVL